ncbi:MAG: hypothetical protein ABSB63_02220 [Spirochaetia bacterium]|jgi:hypothetical protein
MNEKMLEKIDSLREDFKATTGDAFQYFYCPILFQDENVQLCKAHIINRALPKSAKDWTIQRKDVDNFYGSIFESDFAAIKYKDNRSVGDAFVDKDLSRVIQPKIIAGGKPVEYFHSDEAIPEKHTRMVLEHQGKSATLWLKMSPSELVSKQDVNWELEVEKDIRIPALVSLIKAAHLTLFHLLGYRYALSAGAHFVGYDILGRFYLDNNGSTKQECLQKASSHFKQYIQMVRPILWVKAPIEGTLSDKQMLICQNAEGRYWAFVVFVRIMKTLHAVLLPLFINPEDVAFYLEFMNNDVEAIEVCWGQFKTDHWEIDKSKTKLRWPKKGILLP